MRIAGIQKTTLLDFPGRVACVVFTQGCRYDCYYCHNRTMVPGTNLGFCIQNSFSVPGTDLFSFLTSRVGLLQGVVVSGGEPTEHEDLPELVDGIKRLGFEVKLDTNGSSPMMVDELLSHHLVDYVALDVKAPWNRYREICGVRADPDTVEQTLHLLQRLNIGWEVRTTVCPTLDEYDMRKISRQIGQVPTWRWNPYRIPPLYKKSDADRVMATCASAETLRKWSIKLQVVQREIVVG
ncbi:MAG TPA: anaerobic ribonucleoside-triphosphate reductase activating protein [Sphaerochaeta sp.]|nr:anaerobic ribonucleoside-triphosphate reductase activating protein [Sphaerochaeta sp.]